MSKWIKVATKSEIPEGGSKVFSIEDREIAVFNVKGEVFAIDNFCRHKGGPLGEGALEDKLVSCPHHGWVFDVTSGRCMTRQDVSQATYSVKIEKEAILIEFGK